MFLFLIFLCTTIVIIDLLINSYNQEIMSSKMKTRVQPKSITRHHHRLPRIQRPRRRCSSTVKTKLFSVIDSISKYIHRSCNRLVKFFSKLASRRSRYHQDHFAFLQQGETLFETEFGHGIRLEFETTFGLLHQLRILNQQQHHQLLPPLVNSDKKGTIVLDLDETLVHSSPEPPTPTYDFMIKPSINGIIMNFYVLKRPGVDEFLEEISEKYEIVVFTAGVQPYASLILDILDPKGLISHRLYRDSCKEERGRFVKDLSKIGRDLGKVVIVDDNPKSYSLQPANAIPMKRFEGEIEDRELGKVMGFFSRYCDGFEDMRDAVKQYLNK